MTIIHLTTPMSDDKHRKRYIKALIDGIEQYTEKQMAKDTAAEWQAGYEAGVEAAIQALEADAKLCDCLARVAGECGCGAWCEWKLIRSARAVEIVRALKDTK